MNSRKRRIAKRRRKMAIEGEKMMAHLRSVQRRIDTLVVPRFNFLHVHGMEGETFKHFPEHRLGTLNWDFQPISPSGSTSGSLTGSVSLTTSKPVLRRRSSRKKSSNGDGMPDSGSSSPTP